MPFPFMAIIFQHSTKVRHFRLMISLSDQVNIEIIFHRFQFSTLLSNFTTDYTCNSLHPPRCAFIGDKLAPIDPMCQ